MKICGVDISGSEARFVITIIEDGDVVVVGCKTKKISLSDDKDAENLHTFLQALKNLANENYIEVFSLKARNHGGPMGGGAVSFKIETLLQLAGRPVSFVNAVALSKFSKGNLGGIPSGLHAYQRDAYLCAVYHLHKIEMI